MFESNYVKCTYLFRLSHISSFWNVCSASETPVITAAFHIKWEQIGVFFFVKLFEEKANR